MHTSPQQIRLSRDGTLHEATVSWWLADDGFAVEIVCDALGAGAHRAHASDAFEALCLLREGLEPQGWRVGVVGARIDVWPAEWPATRAEGRSLIAGRGAIPSTASAPSPRRTPQRRSRSPSSRAPSRRGSARRCVPRRRRPADRSDGPPTPSAALASHPEAGEGSSAPGSARYRSAISSSGRGAIASSSSRSGSGVSSPGPGT